MTAIKQLLAQEKLSTTFEQEVLPHYAQLASAVAKAQDIKNAPLLVAVNGAQGTGKSTLALFIQAFLQEKGKPTAVLSIDDLYLTHQERQQLGQDSHPLFKTRGVPGTHDLVLGQSVIDALLSAERNAFVKIPSFDKAQDDRKPEAAWPSIEGPVDIILLEGWCVGASPMAEDGLLLPINPLETDEDPQQTWRMKMNTALAEQYQSFFSQFDLLIMLKAPSFDCVSEWRALQEEKLARKMQVNKQNDTTTNNGAQAAPSKGLMNNDALKRFMMHYERLTKHMLKTMPPHADVLIELAEDHSIENIAYQTLELPND